MIVIDENSSETVANNARAVGSVSGRALWSYQVPQGSKLIITKFGNYIDPIVALGSIEWSFHINGVPAHYPYGLILDVLGRSFEPRKIVPIVVNGGDLFEIDGFNNASGNPCEIGCAVVGELWEAR